MNAKRTLPVTPFTAQADEESMDTDQEPLPTVKDSGLTGFQRKL